MASYIRAMIIGIVLDQYDTVHNGIVTSARRFVENFRALGHTVRILTTGEPGKDKFILPVKYIPMVSYFGDKQGMIFAKKRRKVIEKFLDGLDVVHFYIASPVSRPVEKLARKKGIKCIAAFHTQAENFTYLVKLGHSEVASDVFYKFLYRYFFKRFRDIHCPTKFIAKELLKHGYKAKMHVISNGVDEVFVPGKPVPHEHIRILMIGRLAPEKRQDLIIDAAKNSKYADQIQLVFAGKGPMLEKYQKLAKGLAHEPSFGFYSTEELLQVIRSCDLYVHASDAEIEAIACMEAFSCGLVPVISNSPKSATPHFALDERSLFEPGNALDLAKKLDYWIENPKERKRMGKLYAEEGDEYRVSTSVKKMLKLYKAIKPGRR